jgi:site-specific DNA-methyltransferase (adenine-specific)
VQLLRLPRDLPVQRRPLTVAALADADRAAVRAVLGGAARGAVVEADNLDLLAALPGGSIDLCYADPPFGTGETQRLERIRTGDGEQTRRGFGGREYRYEVISDHAYDDGLGLDAHLAAVRARVEAIHRVLAPHGSLYLHCDWRTVHHLRLLLDEVFGSRRFLNELVWAYDYGGRHRDRWPRKHDTILWYAKGDEWRFERDAIDRVPYLAPGLVGPEKAARGKLPTDVWWHTIVSPTGKEKTGYPTQKPAGILRRIVQASSREGDWVLDFFAGSGTTGAVAAELGRRFLLVDESAEAIAVIRKRLAGLIVDVEFSQARPAA